MEYKIYHADVFTAMKKIKSNSIDCVVTSIPYWQQRDYEGHNGQIGLEPTMEEYIDKIVSVFDEIYRILKPTGTLFLNTGDTYSNGSTKLIGNTERKGYGKNKGYVTVPRKTHIKKKSKMMIPQRIAIEMIDRGWILRNNIIWNKLNPMPESVNDRFTNDFEDIFFFTKSTKYYFNKQFEPYSEKTLNGHGKDGVIGKGNKVYTEGKNKMRNEVNTWVNAPDERGRNKRCIWPISTTSTYKVDHCATFPPKLVETCLDSGCPKGGIVYDPFLGSGTTMDVAKKKGMSCIGSEIVEKYVNISKDRVTDLFTNVIIEKVG